MTDIRLGLRANAAQFSLLVGLNALVGAMVGSILSFVVAFGVAKAFANLAPARSPTVSVVSVCSFSAGCSRSRSRRSSPSRRAGG